MLKESRKKFLFGRTYTIVDSTYNAKDDTYITEKEMYKIFSSKSEFEINKNNFLDDFYKRAATKQTEYYLYNATILYNEKLKDKDISEFSSCEIKDLIESVATGSAGQKYRVFKFINQYCKWRVSNGFISLNPCDNLNKKDFTANINILKNNIIGLDMFWDMINEMMLNGCHVQLVLPLVLSRYGIYGKDGYDLLHLRYDQINTKEKIVTLYDEEGTFKTSLLVDDRFIQLVDDSKYEDVVDSDYNGVYLNTGYIIRRSSLAGKNAGDIETKSGFIRRANLAYSYAEDWPKVKLKNLTKSRKLDFIFNIRSNRKINTEDVLNVIRIFDPKASDSNYHSLVSDIKSLTNEKVLFKYEKGEKLIDENAPEFVKSIVDNLQFEGYELNCNSLAELLNINLDINIRNFEKNSTSQDTTILTKKLYEEGKLKLETHLKRERNSKVVKDAKRLFFNKNKRLYCELCGFDFEKVYGELGKNFIEGHHIKPISDMDEGGDVNNVEDIKMLCSNCHRIVHIGIKRGIDLEDIKSMMIK